MHEHLKHHAQDSINDFKTKPELSYPTVILICSYSAFMTSLVFVLLRQDALIDAIFMELLLAQCKSILLDFHEATA